MVRSPFRIRGLLSSLATVVALGVASTVGRAEEPVDPIEAAQAPCKEADAELNRVYRKVRQVYKQDKAFLEKLKLAQRAWIKFRDAHIASVFPIEEPGYYGSVVNECHCWIYASLTAARTKFFAPNRPPQNGTWQPVCPELSLPGLQLRGHPRSTGDQRMAVGSKSRFARVQARPGTDQGHNHCHRVKL